MLMLKNVQKTLLLCFFLSLNACLEEPVSVILEQEQDLLIFGKLWDNEGQAANNARVFIEDQRDPVAVTDAEGDFSFMVNPREIIRISSRLPIQRSGLRLYYEMDRGSDRPLLGISKPINLMLSGELDLGISFLEPGVNVEGRVFALPRNRDLEPAIGARVLMGRAQVFTDNEGRFRIEGLPRGQLPVQILATGLGPYYSNQIITTAASQTLEPVVLFPEYGVSGAMLLADPSSELSQIEAVLRPFRKSFRVLASSRAALVRLDHRREALNNSENESATVAPASWLSLSQILDYDFPGEGAFTVYYQFANQDQSEISQVFQLPVLVDRFGGSSGILIDNGAEQVSSSQVEVSIDVPGSAVRMRMAESEFELLQKGWVPTQQQLTYDFQYNPDLAGQRRRLLLQFQDRFGNVSRTYEANVRLVLFPETGNFIEVNGGNEVSSSATVAIALDLPATAYEMRIFEEAFTAPPGTTPVAEWIEAQSLYHYTFQQSGLRSLLIQLRDINGNRSVIYTRNIEILP